MKRSHTCRTCRSKQHAAATACAQRVVVLLLWQLLVGVEGAIRPCGRCAVQERCAGGDCRPEAYWPRSLRPQHASGLRPVYLCARPAHSGRRVLRSGSGPCTAACPLAPPTPWSPTLRLIPRSLKIFPSSTVVMTWSCQANAWAGLPWVAAGRGEAGTRTERGGSRARQQAATVKGPAQRNKQSCALIPPEPLRCRALLASSAHHVTHSTGGALRHKPLAVRLALLAHARHDGDRHDVVRGPAPARVCRKVVLQHRPHHHLGGLAPGGSTCAAPR